MDRHQLPFPNKDFFQMLNGVKDVLPNRIEECWHNGIFDEYSDQHFLIRAINNDIDFFEAYYPKQKAALSCTDEATLRF